MKNILLISFLFISFVSQSQNPNIKRTWHWYFGIFAGIDFSSGSAVVDTNGGLATPEGCATISDTSGNLLFYTNGRVVWNSNHDTMPHGTSLMGGSSGSSTQSSLIIPQPGSPNIFYLFTADEYPGTLGLRYTIIDMNLDNGNGDVDTAQKNVLLFAPSTEKLSAVNHCNDSSVWIAGHKEGSNEFYSYLLSSQGLNLSPVISGTGTVLSLSQGLYSMAGQLKFSSNGKKAATTCNNSNSLELFDFDNQLGAFSHPIILSNTDTLAYGVEFSPNNKLLYNATIFGNLFQYDISSNDSNTIISSKTLIHHYPNILPGFGQLQNGFDGKIYIGSSQLIYKASAINYPDSAGIGCGFSDTIFNLLTGANRLGITNFNCSYFNSSSGFGCINGLIEKTNNLINNFPNPARDWIVLEGTGIKSIEIINLLGSKIGSYPATASALQNRINVSSLCCGIYFLKIYMKDERCCFLKIIVQY